MNRSFSFWQPDIPADNPGFGQFSPVHFAWLMTGVIICFAFRGIYRHSERKQTVRLTVSLSALILELFTGTIYAVNGLYDIWTLPLHLCGISVFLEVLHSFWGNDTLGQFLYAFSFPGAVFALVFPDWSYFPAFNILTVIEFLKHILLVTYVVMQTEDIRSDIKKTPGCLALMIALALPVFCFDRLTGTNYMFLNWPVPPLTWFSFLGNPGYLLGYLPLLAAAWAIIYAPQSCQKRNRFGKSGKQ